MGLLYQPLMVYQYGAFGEMRIGRGNGSTVGKPALVPICRQQIDRTPASAVRCRRLTARLTQSAQTSVNIMP
jgi:hypothetical protein